MFNWQDLLFTVTTAEERYKDNQITNADLFQELFNENLLKKLFIDEFLKTTGKGIDRINGFQFSLDSGNQLQIASRKCKEGTYRFSPYLEVLKLKGRTKLPRLIGIPTVRDRVILCQLNKYLAAVFPESVPKNVAASFVRVISEDMPHRDVEATFVCSTDIKTFYDSIPRDRLLKILKKKIVSKEALSLIRHALYTPTVPKNSKRKSHADYKTERGIPQGLAISNILASIYLRDVDVEMRKLGVTYYRYVDDVLMYGEHDAVHQAYTSLKNRLNRRGLALHTLGSGKTQIKPLGTPFGYLGYHFKSKVITVREATIERFIQSIASKFSDFTHNKTKRLARFNYLNEDRLKEIFILELNERITGAISESRRYGWIAYFNQINDLTLLHKIDRTISGLFKRLPEFNNLAPTSTKKVARAYWEIKYNPTGGYIHNYDSIITIGQKLLLLQQRGRIGPDETLSDAEVDERYDKYRSHILSAMHNDEGSVYT